MRIAGNDFVENSNTNENAVEFCKLMESCGIDMLNVTGGWHESVVPQITGDLPRGGYSYLAAAIKDAVHIPVAVSNRINDPVVAEKLLATGVADMVCVGRPHIADPDWVKKTMEGRANEIRRCVACNQGCLAKTFFMKPIECLVNGLAGREYLVKKMYPTKVKKRILVIGAGPAGCEFAIRAAELGHSVTVWEKEDRIGGQLHMVAAPPGKYEFYNFIEYLDTMLRKNHIDVKYGKKASASEIKRGDFDIVVTAVGVIPNTISLPGKSSIPVFSVYDVLTDKAIPGANVVIIGGGSVGCEAAQYMVHDAGASPEQIYFLLAHKAETVDTVLKMLNSTRRNITIVDIAKIGTGFDPGTGWPVMKDLRRFGVKQYPLSSVKMMDDTSVTITMHNTDSGEQSDVSIPCDTVVLSVGAKSNNALYNELKAQGICVINLGDSEKIGKVIDAIRAADDLAFKL
jgi:2,4-dienoyl-CoA reductase (NADPH2)